MKRKVTLVVVLCFTMIVLFSNGLIMADFPEGPINVIIPFSPGGGTDTSMRTLQPIIEEELGVRLNFVYMTGAGGARAYSELEDAEPDGYTIGAVNWPHFFMPFFFDEDPGYNFNAVEPLALYNQDVAGLSVLSDSQWEDFEDFKEDALNRPGQISVALPVPYSYPLVGLLKMKEATGIELADVNFEGGGPSAHAFMGGHVDSWLINTSVKNRQDLDKINPLVVLGTNRVDYLPDTPTLEELGYPSVEVYTRRSLVVPKGVSEERMDILANAVRAAVTSEEFEADAIAQGAEPIFMAPAELNEVIQKEIQEILELFEEAEIDFVTPNFIE